LACVAFGALLGLDPLPDALDLLGPVGVHVAVDVWMAPHQLASDVFDDLLDAEVAGLLGDRRLHEDVREHDSSMK